MSTIKPNMTDCNETLRELDAFLDDELPSDVRDHIHGHLTDCYDCFEAFDFHAELKDAIRRKCANDPMPESLLVKLEACLTVDFTGDLAADADTPESGSTPEPW